MLLNPLLACSRGGPYRQGGASCEQPRQPADQARALIGFGRLRHPPVAVGEAGRRGIPWPHPVSSLSPRTAMVEQGLGFCSDRDEKATKMLRCTIHLETERYETVAISSQEHLSSPCK